MLSISMLFPILANIKD